MLNNKVVLISGCSSGFGKYLSEYLSQREYKVYAGIRNDQKRNDLGKVWTITHPTIIPIALDITSDESCNLAVEIIIEKERHLDVLVNNAGLKVAGSILSFTSKDFADVLDTNIIGAFRLTKATLPHMLRKEGGKIINITSLFGIVARPNFSTYCASKFALEGFGQSLRYEVAKQNVWVTNVAPANIGMKEGVKKHEHEKNIITLIKKLALPVFDASIIANKVDWIIRTKKPPPRVVIGISAKILTLFQGLLQNNVFDRVLRYIG